jgi:ABC transporter DrrB family efflux protein
MTGVSLARPGTPVPRLTPVLVLRDIGGVAKRNLIRSVRTPQLVLYLVQPLMMLLLFRYIFGGAIKVPHGGYVDFVVPAIFLITVLVGAMTSAIGIAEDLKSGMIDRFRSLPMARSAFLAGRTLADICRSALALAFMIGLGLAVGFRFHSGVGACFAGVALVVAFGYAFSWVYAAVGLAVKDPQTAQMAAILPMFILFFASSALVPVSTMPGWLQAFARNQPASVTIEAVRSLLEGGPVYHLIWQAVLWSAGIFVVFLSVSLRLYRSATA